MAGECLMDDYIVCLYSDVFTPFCDLNDSELGYVFSSTRLIQASECFLESSCAYDECVGESVDDEPFTRI